VVLGLRRPSSFLGLLTFVYVPIVWSAWLSFYDARNTVTPDVRGVRQLRRHAGRPAFRSSMLTFLVFLFRQYFLGFRREIEDAARIDGLGYFVTFWRVVLPNSLGFVAAIGTLTFIGSWNAFLWPLVIGQDQNTWTVKIALSTFLTQQTSNQHQLFVAAAISILPLLGMLVLLRRWIVQGVERSGINE
jgi:ABC-type glycerol-3-phosphate transport system permease component